MPPCLLLPFLYSLKDLFGVAFRLYFRENPEQLLVGADKKGCPLDADHFLAIHVLLLEHAKLFAHFFVYISKEWIRKVILCLEFRLSLRRVARDAQHDGACPETIGHAVSSGCFRLVNDDVTDLYSRVPLGTKVLVQHQ